MRIEDLTVEVRDKTLKRVGKVPSSLVHLTVTPVHNGVGSWSLTLPAEHELATALRVPGAGIIVTGPTDVIASGPTTSPSLTAGADDPLGLVTVSGLTDDVLLADALAWPQPTNADVATQAAGYDNRSGVAETVMRAYVDANIGPSAPATRRGLLAQKLTLAPDLGRGPSVVKSARFPTLGELLSEIAGYSGLGFRVVQRGEVLVFEVYEVADRSKFIRLDIHNGGLSSQRVEVSPPGVTLAIVAGQGEGAARTLLARSTTASTTAETAWGRRIEVFKDQRNTDDLTELQQAGDEILAESGFTATNVKGVPAESTTMLYGRDYREGDKITVVVEGQENTATVTQATVMADKDGVLVGVGAGDVSGFDAASAQARRVDNTAKRVSELERTSEAGVMTGEIRMWPGATAPAGWLFCRGQVVSRTTYAEMFAVIGTSFDGDAVVGPGEFRLPPMQARVPLGADDAYPLGAIGGSATHTLTEAQMPSHTHVQNPHNHATVINRNLVNARVDGGATYNVDDNGYDITSNATATNQATGGGQAHPIMQPWASVNYIIKT